MPPKRKVETVDDKTKAPPAKKTSEERHQPYHTTKVQLVRQQHHPKPWKQECKQVGCQ